MKKRVPIAIAAALAACGAVALTLDDAADSKPSTARKSAAQDPAEASLRRARELNNATDEGGMAGCFSPSLSGYQRQLAESVGGKPCDEEDAGAVTGEAGGDAWAGKYEGDFDGGRGSVTIAAPDRRGVHRVDLVVAGQGTGCSGEVAGSGVPRGDLLSLRIPNDDGSGGICSISLTRRGRNLDVQESGCAYHHGMSCGFSGSVTRRGGAVSASSPVSPARSASWLLGTWVNRGAVCGSDGITFRKDGSFSTTTEQGTWSLTGNVLTVTTRVNFDDMENEEGTPVQNPRPVRSTILSSSGRAYTMKNADGTVWNIVRCE